MADQLSAHDAAMVAKVDANTATINAAVSSPIGGTPAAAPTAAQRPEHVPEKFWDAATGQVNTEALLKSYTELEKGKPAEQQPAPVEGQADPAAAAISAAKLDAGKLSQEWVANGTLSDDSYKALEAAGFGKDIVDGYIAGQVALAERRDNSGFQLAGGKESFDKMAAWAQTALAPADIETFNTAVIGTEAQMKQAIVALRAQYEAAVGKDPALVSGGAVQDAGEQPFQSRAEVTVAMRDPRYKSDPAYRALVERRVGLMPTF